MTGSEVEQKQSNREENLQEFVIIAAQASPSEWLLLEVKEARKNPRGIAMMSGRAGRTVHSKEYDAQGNAYVVLDYGCQIRVKISRRLLFGCQYVM